MPTPDETETLIDTYCAAWNHSDAAQRREILAKVWNDDATYTDPSVHAAGIDALLAHIATVVADRPGVQVLRTSSIDRHHQVVRFAWTAIQADGAVLLEGLDFAELSDGGRIRRIVGFFGPLSSRARQ
jgi:SnoaL-like domain